jgi:hypothetical protein
MKRISLWLVLVCLATAATPPAKKLNVKATAEWICGLFEVKEGQMFVASRDLDHLENIRYRLPANTEIKPLGGGFAPAYRGVIIDQADLYPIEIHCAKLGYGEYELCINSPFHYLMDSLPSDIDPASKEHPKAALITEADFRPIAEQVHAHFTRITQVKPHAFRLQSEDGWPSEHYVWSSTNFTARLSVYHANDHVGLEVSVKKPGDELKKLQTSRKGKEEPCRGWGGIIGEPAKP